MILFFEFLSDDGETAEREVFLDQIGSEDYNQQSVDDESSPDRKDAVGILHSQEEHDGE